MTGSSLPSGASAAAEPPWDINPLHRSIVQLLQRLVRTPSRADLDSSEPILRLLEGWLDDHGLTPRRLRDAGDHLVGLDADVHGARPGPRYVLNACVDTAPYGDERAWSLPPTSGAIVDGWLYGRGSADCKVAAAIFCHLAEALRAEASRLAGTVTVLFDADEHSGGFAGAKAYFGNGAMCRDVAGVLIGYPGDDRVIVGSRGFLRARLTVHGIASHSGGSKVPRAGNAVEKAALLVRQLGSLELPEPVDGAFPLPPKLTVTAIHGGEGYTIVPDTCEVDVDVRLTPTFNAVRATSLLHAAARTVDEQWPTGHPTAIDFNESWPAYRLAADSPLAMALTGAVMRVTGRQRVRMEVSGPSNIGNYLAALGIEATAGFGATYRNLHGIDECVKLSTIPIVHDTYRDAVRTLLNAHHEGGRNVTEC